jgi:xylose dehydrogenase (NAD/NADP)
MHHEWTMRALAAGKHVLCEKPYTRNPAEVEEAFAAADAAGLVLMEAFMYRHHPQTSQIAGLVADGAIGRLVSVMGSFSFRLEDLSDVRALPELDGGALMDLGCYCVSNSRVLAGEPVSASAVQATGTTGIDMSLFGTLRFENDVVSLFVSSFSAPRRQYLEVVGEQGVIRVHAPWRVDWPGALELVRNGMVESLDVEEANSYTEQLVNMAAAVAGSAPARLGRDDALGQARAIDALYRSAEAEEVVALG